MKRERERERVEDEIVETQGFTASKRTGRFCHLAAMAAGLWASISCSELLGYRVNVCCLCCRPLRLLLLQLYHHHHHCSCSSGPVEVPRNGSSSSSRQFIIFIAHVETSLFTSALAFLSFPLSSACKTSQSVSCQRGSCARIPFTSQLSVAIR